ncbi:MAG TPA: serine--tRNA ligase, partial [Patescibacteria group bacterium]|nr:serine--tRNA ligase [Patescibacteria group bacterium]
MLDIKLIRENPEEIKKGIARKGAEPALIDELLDLDQRRRELIAKLETFQGELNVQSKEIAQFHGQQKIDAIKEASESSEKIGQLKPELDKVEIEYRRIMLEIPNPPSVDVIDGKSDKDNSVNRTWGEPTKFDFTPLDHVEIGKNLDLIDTARAGKVAGSRFYYLKNELVVLE